MKTKMRINVIIPLIFLGLVASAVPATIVAVDQLNNQQQETLFEEQYVAGNEIVIPDLELGGVKAEKYIVYPNGRVFKRDSFTPDLIGYYTVRYVTENDSEEYSFYVAGQKYYVEGTGSAVYGAHPKTPSKESLIVSLGANSKFHYDEIININNVGKKNLIDFYPVASSLGSLDAYTIKIRFTDVYDESKYLQFEVDASRQGVSHQAVYMRAGGENQIPTGVETHSGKIYTGTIFGYAFPCTMYSCTADGKPFTEAQYISNRIGLGYEPKSNIATSLPNSQNSTFIVDMNDSTYFSDFWEGLTTGEAKMSLWFENFVSGQATVCITSIGDSSISRDIIVDDKLPTLEINDVFGELPNAIINQKYKFYDVRSLDAYSGELRTDIRVYRDYYSNKTEVAKLADGFVPTRLGKYYIEYTARDFSNNVVTKLYEVDCVNEERSYELTLTPGYATEGYVGEIISLATVETSGQTGVAEGYVTVTEPDGNVFTVENFEFVGQKAGTHTVTYTYEDFIGTIETISYEINVTVSAAPIINEKITLLPYYIAGYEYTLPSLRGTDFNVSSDTLVEADITLVDGDDEIAATDGKLTFPAGDTQIRDVVVRYTCSNGTAAAVKEYPTRVVTTTTDGFIHMENYFDAQNATVSTTKTTVDIETATTSTVTFVNNLAASGFETNFSIRQGMSSFEKLNIYLTDSINPEETIKVTYYLGDEGKTQTMVNDNTLFIYKGVGLFDGGLQFLKVDTLNKRVQTNPNEIIPVKSYMNGDDFVGFSSQSVYMTFEFVNPSNNKVGISITDINAQEMSNSKYDYIRPRVILSGDYGGARNIGDTVEICSATAYDVLDPTPTINLSVFDTDNNILKDVNGLELSEVACNQTYKFEATEYGSYRVSYAASDYDENLVYFSYLIVVYDKVAPTIKVNGSVPKTAKVGDTIKVPGFSATDNLTAKENILTAVYVISPSGVVNKLQNNSFTFVDSGRHIVRYIAIDEEGNTAHLDFYVQVSEVQ